MVVDDVEEESLKFAATRYIDAITGIVGLIIYTNVLTTTSVGLYFTGVAIFSISSSVSNGLYAGVKKKGTESDTELSKYFSLAVVGSITYAIVGSIIIILGYIMVTSNSFIIQYQVPTSLLYGILIRFIPECLYRSVATAYDSNGDVALTGYYDLLRGIIQTILQIALIIVTADLLYLFVGSAISTVVIGSVMYARLENVEVKRFSLEKAKEIKSFAIWNSIDSLSKGVEPRITTIIISVLLSPALAGIYGVVLRTTRPALYVSRSLSRTLFVETSYRQSNDESIKNEISSVMRYAPILAIPMVFGVIGLSEEILSFFYTPEYAKGSLVLLGMALATVIKSESKIFGAYMYGCNRPKIVTKSALISVITSISILLLGFEYIGFNILLLSLVVSRLFELVYLYKKSDGLGSLAVYKSVTYQFMSSGIMLLFILAQKQVIEIESYIVPVSIILSGLVYFMALSAIDGEFRGRFVSYTRKYL